MNIKKKVLVWLTSAFLICTTIFGSLLNSHITKANNSPTNETSQELKKAIRKQVITRPTIKKVLKRIRVERREKLRVRIK